MDTGRPVVGFGLSGCGLRHRNDPWRTHMLFGGEAALLLPAAFDREALPAGRAGSATALPAAACTDRVRFRRSASMVASIKGEAAAFARHWADLLDGDQLAVGPEVCGCVICERRPSIPLLGTGLHR